MRFRDVRHQERALSILRRALAAGRTHHAYLFDGPEGVGKEMTARALSAHLLCHAPASPDAQPSLFSPAEPADDDASAASEPCGECTSCRLFAADTHPDFHLIHRGIRKFHPDRSIRESKGLFLAVELIRHFLIVPSTTTPALAHSRVFLIRDAERMNEGAQNALLKTLEEPPGETRLILVTASASRLLPTIRSRCQRIPFALLPPEYVEEELVSQGGVEPAAARSLARISNGRLGAAMHWNGIGLLETLGETARALEQLPARDPEGFANHLIEAANGLAARTIQLTAEQEANEAELQDAAPRRRSKTAKAAPKTLPTDDARTALKLVLMLVGAIYRDALIARTAAGDDLRCLDQERTLIDRIAAGASADSIEDAVRAVAHVETMIDRNVAPQLSCERLAVALLGEVPVS